VTSYFFCVCGQIALYSAVAFASAASNSATSAVKAFMPSTSLFKQVVLPSMQAFGPRGQASHLFGVGRAAFPQTRRSDCFGPFLETVMTRQSSRHILILEKLIVMSARERSGRKTK